MSFPQWYTSAPIFSEQDEREEKEALTENERRQVHTDVYGEGDESFEEDSQSLAKGIAEMRDAIENIPREQKKSYLRALEEAPDVAARESPPAFFLRCEEFNVWAAAQRIVNYWNQRYLYFGEDRAFLPLRMNRSLTAEDMLIFEKAVYMILPRDNHGRQVVLVNRAKYTSDTAPHQSICCALFFITNLLLKGVAYRESGSEGPSSSLSGKNNEVVVVFNMQRLDLREHVDRPLAKKVKTLFLTALPLSIKSIHCCTGPGKSVAGLILPILKKIYGRRLRLRTFLHAGSGSEVIQRLQEFGLREEHVAIIYDKSADHREEVVKEWIAMVNKMEEDKNESR